MNTLDARRRLLGRNVYKKTVEGNPAIAQGSLARRDPGIEMQGWTEQAQYEGKNLFDVSSAKQVDSWETGNAYRNLTTVDLKPNTTYTLFVQENNMYKDFNPDYNERFALYLGEIKVDSASNYLFGNTNVDVVPDSYTFTTSDNPFYINLYIDVWNEENLHIVFDELLVGIMLVEGASIVPYEPYTGRQPSPSPDYKQDVKNAGKYDEETQKYEHGIELAGKNLLDEKSVAEVSNVSGITIEWLEDEKCFLLNGTCTRSEAFAITDINVKGNVGSYYTASVYRISGDVLIPEGGFCVAYFGVNDSPTSGGSPRENWISPHVENGNNNSTTKVLNNKYINTFWFYITEGVSLVNYKINVMLELRTKQTAYEPYRTPQTVTLTADRPLTKWDRLEKRNGQWGWVYKSGVKQLISDMYIIKNTEGTYQVSSFVKVDRNRLAESLSTHFIYKLSTTEYGNFWFDSAGTGLRFRMSQFQTVEEVKDWLQENEVYFAFPNAEETFVPLTAAEQEQMNALHTNRPTTVLTNDCDCNMTLTYKTKKSMGGGNPYGLEIGMIGGSSGGNVNGYPNRIRTGYITFYSPDGDRTIHAIGYTTFVILTAHAYDKDKKWISQFSFWEGRPPAGTNYVRYALRKIDESNVTSDELNNLIKTFDVERSD